MKQNFSKWEKWGKITATRVWTRATTFMKNRSLNHVPIMQNRLQGMVNVGLSFMFASSLVIAVRVSRSTSFSKYYLLGSYKR